MTRTHVVNRTVGSTCNACQEPITEDTKKLRPDGTMFPECRPCINRKRRDKLALLKETDPEAHKANRDRERERYRAIRKQFLDMHNHTCRCCGETHDEFLTLDHVNGDGAKERGGNKNGPCRAYRAAIDAGPNSPDYRCLCCNCNFAIGRYGYCPHGNLPPRNASSTNELEIPPNFTP